MKKFIGVLSLVAFCFGFFGCRLLPAIIPQVAQAPEPTITTERTEERLMLRDFEVLGIMFITSSATINARGEITEGSDITSDMLMREVLKFGGHDYINLRIDERKTTNGVVTFAEYKASALAIKYK